MKYIAIDTSGPYLTVIAKNGDKTEKIFIDDCAMTHSVLLLGNVQKALDSVDLQVKDVDFCAVVVGPGSFTGIRIGVATAKGLVAAFGKKVLAVTSFDIVAYAVKDEKILAVIDANHDNFYVAPYCNLQLADEPKFVDKKALSAYKGYKAYSFKVISSVTKRVADVCLGLENYILKNYQNAVSANEISPFYLRLSQAEEGRK